MTESTVTAAVSRLRNKTRQLPPDIATAHRPPLLSFSEFIARSKNRELPESIRIANRQLAEEIVSDDTIDYCYSEIPLSADDTKKSEAVSEVAESIGRFVDLGNVLVFAICVRPE
jgi:hypothetical protein